MKQLLLSGFLLCSGLLFAQEKLIIEYEQKNVHNPEKARVEEIEFKKKYPGSLTTMNSTFTSYYVLEFGENRSTYGQKETLNNSQESGGFSTSIHIGGEFKETTGDLLTKGFKREVKFDGENYIVNYPFKEYEWKITDETSTVADYKVTKAVSEKNGIVAWFAPDIKVNSGPNQINGLPGLVLKTEEQLKNKLETKITVEAIKINLSPKKLSKEKAAKGKNISEVEFKKLQDESHKKMRESFSVGVDKK